MNIEDYAELFKAISHPVRLKIVCGLMRKENCNVSTMSEKLSIPQPTVSQHLNILKNANIIAGYRNGNQICYKLENPVVIKIIKSLEVQICEL
ncbi:MAG: ArsR/SmtB family transcription factor [Candidatus Ozemobacteraceae bacterium]|jgi:ArsR family transcriptional regulator